MTQAFQAVGVASAGSFNWGIALAILSLFVSVVLVFVQINSKRSWAKSEQFNELQRTHSILSERVQHLPSAEGMADLSGSMRELTVEVRGLRDDVGKIENRMDMYEQAVLERRPT